MTALPPPGHLPQIFWHFLPLTRTLGYGDGRKVRPGETLSVPGPPVLCHRGLHASPSPFLALSHTRGPVLTQVTLGGEIIHEFDKSVATERHTLAIANVAQILRQFALDLAAEAWYQHFERGLVPAVDAWLDGEALGSWGVRLALDDLPLATHNPRAGDAKDCIIDSTHVDTCVAAWNTAARGRIHASNSHGYPHNTAGYTRTITDKLHAMVLKANWETA